MTYQTFEERQGRVLLLQIVIPGYLSERFRNNLIRAFEEHDYAPDSIDWSDAGALERYVDTAQSGPYGRSVDILNSLELMGGVRGFKVNVLGYRPSQLPNVDNVSEAINYITKVLEGYPAEGQPESVINIADYFLANASTLSGEICDEIERVFINNPTAYAVVRTRNEAGKTLRRIHRAMGNHSAIKLRDALERIEESNAERVLGILWDADERLNEGFYSAAVEEGYGAVEYAAKKLAKQRTGNSGNELGKAIKNLHKVFDKESFPASILQMVEIMGKYANNGKRHKLAIPSNTTREDAVMYLGVCAMAADWLISQMIEQPDGEGE